MSIRSLSDFESRYGKLTKGFPSRPDMDVYAPVWISLGVFFGYPDNEIINFYHQINNDLSAPNGTLFGGTGYVCADGTQDKDKHIEEINSRRYCSQPFPEANYEDIPEHVIRLYDNDPVFFQKVMSIVDRIEVNDVG